MTQPPASQTGRMRTRREVIRQRRRERQVVFFGLLVIAVAATGVWSYLLFTDRATGIEAKPFVTPIGDFDSDIKLPCPPADTLPLPPGEIVVRVQNGTDRQGLAGATRDDFVGRGFIDGGATNWRSKYEDVARIMFGDEGIQQAYTVARYFPEAELVLDTRDGRTIDVVVGSRFDALVSQQEVVARAEEVLEPYATCLPAHLITAIEPGPRRLPFDPTEPVVTPSPSASTEAQ